MDIFSFDLDGTLLPHHDSIIKPEIYDKINSFIDKGDAVIFNSGRPFEILREFMSQIHESGNVYFSIDNGSGLLKQNKEVIYLKPVENKMFKELKFNNPGLSIFTYTLDNLLLVFSPDKYAEYEVAVNKMKLKTVSMDDDLSNYVMMKFLVCGTKEELDNAVISYDKENYTIIRTKATMMEIMKKEADKATAIEFVVSQYEDIKNVYAFGDGDNDALSIKKYTGVTFANGTPSCKENAKYVSPLSSDEGVLDAFHHLSL